MSHAFELVEQALSAPRADGVFVVLVEDEDLPLRPCEIITHVGSTPVADIPSFQEAMQPQDPSDKERTIRVRSFDGSETRVVASGTRGYRICAVRGGESAWTTVPDTEFEPDFAPFDTDVEVWMSNNFGTRVAGFEKMQIVRSVESIEVDILMRLGGALPDDRTWDYRTRSSSRHRLDAGLSTVRTAYWEGPPEEELLHGEVECDGDSCWLGEGIGASGQRSVVTSPWYPDCLTGYTIRLLPLLLPLEAGVSRTVMQASDGIGLVTGRSRLECTGLEDITVADQQVSAWCFTWRHYGHRADSEDERFFVTDDRRLVRVEWGDFYNGCWCESLPDATIRQRIPDHISVD